MARLWVYLRSGGELSNELTINKLMVVARSKIVAGQGPFSMTQDGDPVIMNQSRDVILDKLRKRLLGGEIGPTYRIRNGEKEIVFTTREVAPAIHIIDTNGNDKIDKVWSYTKAEFSYIKFLGAYVCKHVAGTSTMSQHSYGNAVDIGAGTMEQLEDIANWLVAHHEELDLHTVIVNKKIWTISYPTWHYYTGETHYHVHTDCNPNFTGGCGVRG